MSSVEWQAESLEAPFLTGLEILPYKEALGGWESLLKS